MGLYPKGDVKLGGKKPGRTRHVEKDLYGSSVEVRVKEDSGECREIDRSFVLEPRKEAMRILIRSQIHFSFNFASFNITV